MRRINLFPVLAMTVLLGGLPGCGDDITPPEIMVARCLPPTSEKNVLENLRRSWNRQEVAEYASLLADDYRFHFDSETRVRMGLPEFWTRLDDSLGVAALFGSPFTHSIAVVLDGMGEPQPVTQAGRETWTRIDVSYAYVGVEIDPNPEAPEGRTYRVTNSLQHFHLRRGRTAADTLPASPTSSRWYIVEWDDTGPSTGNGPGWRPARPAAGEAAVEMSARQSASNSTWGMLKALYK